MKKHGIRWKRFGAILLAAALMASALQPVMAAEETKGREETTVAVEESTTENAETRAAETTGTVESTKAETKDSAAETTTEAATESETTTPVDETKVQETETSAAEMTAEETTAATEETSAEMNASDEKKEDETESTYLESGKIAEPKIKLSFFRITEGGKWLRTEEILVNGNRNNGDVTLKELGVTLPEMKPGYKGIRQIGWVDGSNQPISEDSRIGDGVFKAVYEKVPIQAVYQYQNQDGKSVTEEKTFLVSPEDTYADLKAVLEKEAVPKDSTDKLRFQGWEAGCADEKLGDKIGAAGLEDIQKIYVSAVYEGDEEKIVKIGYHYINSEGQWTLLYTAAGTISSMTVGEKETYGEIFKRATANIPSDVSKEYEIDHWELAGGLNGSENEIPRDGSYIEISAVYKNTVLRIRKYYYDNTGKYVYREFPMEVSEGTTKKEVYQKLEEDKAVPPSTYPGLRFAQWTIGSRWDEDKVVSNNEVITVGADYENCIVRYRISPMFTRMEWGYDLAIDTEDIMKDLDLFCQVAEKGEEVPLRTEFDGYKDVKLYDLNKVSESGMIVVDDHVTIDGDGVKLSDIPKDPETPDTPTDPVTVIDQINDAKAGETVVVDMKNTTVVEKEILKAARGKDVSVRFDMGSYSWTINGKSIQESGVKDVNLEVKLDTGVIAESIVGRIAGNLPTRQMSITYDGEFGFTAILSINLGEAYAGKYGNLFYYAGRSRLDFMSAQKVEANGVISVPFTHASDYVFILSDTAMSEKDSTNAGQGTNNQTGGSANADGKDGKSVATGDTTKVFPVVLMGSLSLFVLLYILKKQYTKTR